MPASAYRVIAWEPSIVKLINYQNFTIWKNKIWLQKLANIGRVRPFDIPHHSQFRQFSHFSFDINQFRRLNFSIYFLF